MLFIVHSPRIAKPVAIKMHQSPTQQTACETVKSNHRSLVQRQQRLFIRSSVAIGPAR